MPTSSLSTRCRSWRAHGPGVHEHHKVVWRGVQLPVVRATCSIPTTIKPDWWLYVVCWANVFVTYTSVHKLQICGNNVTGAMWDKQPLGATVDALKCGHGCIYHKTATYISLLVRSSFRLVRTLIDLTWTLVTYIIMGSHLKIHVCVVAVIIGSVCFPAETFTQCMDLALYDTSRVCSFTSSIRQLSYCSGCATHNSLSGLHEWTVGTANYLILFQPYICLLTTLTISFTRLVTS